MRIAVVGAGVVGLATTLELLRSGRHDVRCYESRAPMGARSAGDTRIFRVAHASEALVGLSAEAWHGWQSWAGATGSPLVRPTSTAVSGDIEATVRAMAAAGARHEVRDEVPALPACRPAGPHLVDPVGGVIDARRTGEILIGAAGGAVAQGRQVDLVETEGSRATVWSGGEPWHCDSVVVAAGAGTPALAAPLGVAVPGALAHHARLTFPMAAQQPPPPCWLDRSGAWRTGFTSYGQAVGADRWAVGGQLPDADTRWELGADAVARRSREVLVAYVAEYLRGVVPEPVATLRCTITPGLGDGVACERAGAVLVVWGENLFKLAPVVGGHLARAAVEGSVPAGLASARSDAAGT